MSSIIGIESGKDIEVSGKGNLKYYWQLYQIILSGIDRKSNGHIESVSPNDLLELNRAAAKSVWGRRMIERMLRDPNPKITRELPVEIAGVSQMVVDRRNITIGVGAGGVVEIPPLRIADLVVVPQEWNLRQQVEDAQRNAIEIKIQAPKRRASPTSRSGIDTDDSFVGFDPWLVVRKGEKQDESVRPLLASFVRSINGGERGLKKLAEEVLKYSRQLAHDSGIPIERILPVNNTFVFAASIK